MQEAANVVPDNGIPQKVASFTKNGPPQTYQLNTSFQSENSDFIDIQIDNEHNIPSAIKLSPSELEGLRSKGAKKVDYVHILKNKIE